MIEVEKNAAPDWKSTALKSEKKLPKLLEKRAELSAQMKEINLALTALNTKLYSAFLAAGVDRARCGDYSVSMVTTNPKPKLDEGVLKRLLVEEGMEIDVVMKLWEKASTPGKSSSFIRVYTATEEGEC